MFFCWNIRWKDNYDKLAYSLLFRSFKSVCSHLNDAVWYFSFSPGPDFIDIASFWHTKFQIRWLRSSCCLFYVFRFVSIVKWALWAAPAPIPFFASFLFCIKKTIYHQPQLWCCQNACTAMQSKESTACTTLCIRLPRWLSFFSARSTSWWMCKHSVQFHFLKSIKHRCNRFRNCIVCNEKNMTNSNFLSFTLNQSEMKTLFVRYRSFNGWICHAVAMQSGW